MTDIHNMGSNTSTVFSGKTINQATFELYGETASLFATEIKNNIEPGKDPYVLADLGSHKGELLNELLKFLPEYKLKVLVVDKDVNLLEGNVSKSEKILARAEELPFQDNSIDVIIVRYLLQWNSKEVQQRILKEIQRVTKQFAIIEHAGADPKDSSSWRTKMDNLLDGNEIPELKRTGHYFASRDEVEKWMDDSGIEFKRIRDRKIEDGTDVFVERYNLSPQDSQKARDILGDKNYFWQTDWVVYPRKEKIR